MIRLPLDIFLTYICEHFPRILERWTREIFDLNRLDNDLCLLRCYTKIKIYLAQNCLKPQLFEFFFKKAKTRYIWLNFNKWIGNINFRLFVSKYWVRSMIGSLTLLMKEVKFALFPRNSEVSNRPRKPTSLFLVLRTLWIS